MLRSLGRAEVNCAKEHLCTIISPVAHAPGCSKQQSSVMPFSQCCCLSTASSKWRSPSSVATQGKWPSLAPLHARNCRWQQHASARGTCKGRQTQPAAAATGDALGGGSSSEWQGGPGAQRASPEQDRSAKPPFWNSDQPASTNLLHVIGSITV